MPPALPPPEPSHSYYLAYRSVDRPIARLAAGLAGVIVLGLAGAAAVTGLRQAVVGDPVAASPEPPAQFLFGNLQFGAILAAAVATSWLVYRQGFGRLSSVAGRLRWGWLALASGLAVLPFLAFNAAQYVLDPTTTVAHWRDHSALIVTLVVTTVPLQAAAEEYVTRGLLGRMVAAAVPSARAGLVTSCLVTSLAFAALHGYTSPTLLAYQFAWAAMAWWITHRTGGLEAAIAAHCANNVMTYLTVPWSDLTASPLNDGRTTGWDWAVLAATALVFWLTDRLAARLRGRPPGHGRSALS
ncbi:MAG: CPBP family intramembrane metalloprotease [Propionibacteriaceae bacterium]|jgi:membrane protease YdiL (CAAX protease family)|nr:CPBP family intramembrane metalloprotease [Propionibacteriaceae bacterium]